MLNMHFSKDCKGMIFSTDLLLVLFLFIIILGIIANIVDSSNDKIINPLEVAGLERLSGEVVDNLINNPGTPRHWEELYSFDGVMPGLAIENTGGGTIINTVSFKKIKILENGWYEELINKKMFNKEIKSSIGLYPINCNVESLVIGDSLLIDNDIPFMNPNISNIVVVNRTVKCEFYHHLAIVSVFNGNELGEVNMEYDNGNSSSNSSSLSNNRNLCNHETIANLSHSDSNNYKWVCKEFKITKKDFEKNNYYLFFSDKSMNNDNYWILDDLNYVSTSEHPINREKISLNDNFSDIFENKNSMIFYIHFKINKNKLNDFNAVLVGIPEDIENDNLNIDYFKEQDCYFVMRACYG